MIHLREIFNVIGAYRPAIDSTARDITVFVDDDEIAYIFVSRDNNKSLYCHKLNDDYTGFTGEYSKVIDSMDREAPAVFKYNNNYYIMTSGCTGWNPNPTKIYKSSDIMGTYQEDSIACLNDTNNNSYGSQPTFVLPIDESKTGYKFIAMFDKWNNSDLEKSSYLWLPMFLQDDKFYVDESINTINIDKKVLMTNISDKNNFFYNKSIEYAIQYLYELISKNSGEYVDVASIELSSTSETIDKGNSIKLTYTLLPDNATNKVVNWETSNNSIATVIDGTVTGVAKGSCNITARSQSNNEIYATCNITVNDEGGSGGTGGGTGGSSNIEGAVYSLQSKTFTKTNEEHVDTNVELFDTNKDFTILLNFNNGNLGNITNSNRASLLHCMKEQTPYPGISISYPSNIFQIDYFGSAQTFESVQSSNTDAVKVVIVKSINTVKVYLNGTYAHEFTHNPNNTLIDSTVILGAYKNASGNYGRYFDGTINECKIWLKALSESEISSL